jgi:hypothetical protein
MPARNPIPILSVEERLRVCLTLTKGLYHLSELAGEHDYAGLEDFEPACVLGHVSKLTRALRHQLLAVRGALTFACLSRDAPLSVVSPPPSPVDLADQRATPPPESAQTPSAPSVVEGRSSQASPRRGPRRRRGAKGGVR